MFSLLLVLIYVSFISLGLPDAVLGSAWPLISNVFGVSISSMGIVTIIISAGTIISSLNSSKIIYKIGVHKVTTFSILFTAIGLLGFAASPSFIVLCLWAVPYGLGAGSIDSALNNYVAIHLESRHMSWLHCMWGLGATLGPYLMGMVLIQGLSFRIGYLVLFGLQIFLFTLVLLSGPIWKSGSNENEITNNQEKQMELLSIKEIFKIPGVKQIAFSFFCFCAMEQTTGLWASSYLVYNRGVTSEVATAFAALFYLGITIGRGICGFLTIKYTDKHMIKMGTFIMAMGIVILGIPGGEYLAFIGLGLIGLGSAPVFPCIIHSTPYCFGVKNSQAVIGVQMASAYTGTLIMPAFFGIISKQISINLYPFYIGILVVVMFLMYEWMIRKTDI